MLQLLKLLSRVNNNDGFFLSAVGIAQEGVVVYDLVQTPLKKSDSSRLMLFLRCPEQTTLVY